MISHQSMNARTLIVVNFIRVNRINRVRITKQQFSTENHLRSSSHRIDHRFVLANLERVPVNCSSLTVVGEIDRRFPTVVDRCSYAVIHQLVNIRERTCLSLDEPFLVKCSKLE